MSSLRSSEPFLLFGVVATPEDVLAQRRIAAADRARPLVDFSLLAPPFPREHFPPRKTAEGRVPFRLPSAGTDGDRDAGIT